MDMCDYLRGKGPMDIVKELTTYMNLLGEDTVKAQILQIYLEDNSNVSSILMHNIKLDKEIREEEAKA
jgi:hypothetical protein